MSLNEWREDSSTKPLTTEVEELLTDQDFNEECWVRVRRRKASQLISWQWAVHLTLILTYTVIFALSLRSLNRTAELCMTHLKLPAHKALQQEIRYFPTALQNNPFTGDPRPELDRAWHALLTNNNIRISTSELAELNYTSIELGDGSGMVAQLGVFHALHCLKTIRRFVHKDYYLVNATEAALSQMNEHVDHCIEYIRENLMCHPDISLVTLRWIPTDDGFKPTNKDLARHECVNWDVLNGWAGMRVFDLYRLDLLKRPA
ncbi:MAG: hypothetical protein Q9227_002059 [Pyrenula ochraceoflavens]